MPPTQRAFSFSSSIKATGLSGWHLAAPLHFYIQKFNTPITQQVKVTEANLLKDPYIDS